jgi:membrane protease subunit (stomatin/prohibitin family)
LGVNLIDTTILPINMAIIDRIKWNGSKNSLVWKFDSEELSTWTQLIVNESQEAFLVKEGVFEGPFGAGRHTLSTENIPLLRKIIGMPFGGKSPFSAEVWFTNLATNLNISWGTPDPIQLQDPKYQVMVPIRAFGQYGIKINNSKKFLLKIVGTLTEFDSDAISEYLKGALITKIKTCIANAIIQNGVSVLEINMHLDSLSELIKQSLTKNFSDFGIELTQFNIHSINIPEDDPALITLKNALSKKAEMGIVGFNYQQERSFDVIQTAAGNEGNSGNIMGAGMGMGMGVAIGGPIGNSFGNSLSQLNTNLNTQQKVCANCETTLKNNVKFCENCGTPTSLTCINCGTDLKPNSKFCSDCGTPVNPKKKVIKAKPDSKNNPKARKK